MAKQFDEAEMVRSIIRRAAMKAGLHVRTDRHEDSSATAMVRWNADIEVVQKGSNLLVGVIATERLSLSDPAIEEKLEKTLLKWATPHKARAVQP
jgi:hypothetical protein